jgi:DNA-binding transcriptional ArsR family regulator
VTKIRVDGRTMALSHPTRLAIYENLLNADEKSTVMLQKSTGVTRYHLYHHLQTLVKNGLVENHRDEGRARWWRVTERVTPTASSQADVSGNLPDSVRALLESGADVHFIPIPADRSATLAKSAVSAIAESFGVDLEMGVTFMPNGILVIGPPKRS